MSTSLISTLMFRRIGLIVLLGAVAAQAGHLLIYQLLFGAAAQQVQSSGAHVYFPTVVKTALGVAAAITLGGLFLVGLARILTGRVKRGEAPSFLRLLAALFTIQLAMFLAQESVEAALSGTPGTSIDGLLLLGTLGQLPVAAVAAFALRFLLVEVVPALAEVRLYLAAPQQPLGLVAALTPLRVADVEDLLRSRLGTHLVRKRGPPSF
jgi:hypothetical protein